MALLTVAALGPATAPGPQERRAAPAAASAAAPPLALTVDAAVATWTFERAATVDAPVPPAAVAAVVAPAALATLAAVVAAVGGSVPPTAFAAYRSAAAGLAVSDPGCRLDWSLLAGIGKVESSHGRFGGSTAGADGVVSPPIIGIALDGRPGVATIRDSDGGRLDGDTTYDRAVGPMQFIPGTWAGFGRDGDGDGVADPQNLFDAALSAGTYLCAGAGDLTDPVDLRRAVKRYNNSDSYVDLVLSYAAAYAAGVPLEGPAPVLAPRQPVPATPPAEPASTTDPARDAGHLADVVPPGPDPAPAAVDAATPDPPVGDPPAAPPPPAAGSEPVDPPAPPDAGPVEPPVPADGEPVDPPAPPDVEPVEPPPAGVEPVEPPAPPDVEPVDPPLPPDVEPVDPPACPAPGDGTAPDDAVAPDGTAAPGALSGDGTAPDGTAPDGTAPDGGAAPGGAPGCGTAPEGGAEPPGTGAPLPPPAEPVAAEPPATTP